MDLQEHNIKTIVIDSTYKMSQDQLSHDFQVRFQKPIKVTKGIQLACVYIPFTQYPFRQRYYINDQQQQQATSIQSMSFAVQRKGQQQQLIGLVNLVNTYPTPEQVVQEINLQLKAIEQYSQLVCEYDKYSQRLRFTYPEEYQEITFENVNRLSDIHNILGFGSKQGVKYGLQYDSKHGLSYFQNQLNLQSIPYINIYIQELNAHDNVIFPINNDQQPVSTFNIPVIANRKEVIQLFQDYDTTLFIHTQAEFQQLSIKLLQNGNIPFDINDSRVVLVLKYI